MLGLLSRFMIEQNWLKLIEPEEYWNMIEVASLFYTIAGFTNLHVESM